MTDAATMAKALGGRPAGGGQWLCPCPMPDHGKGRGDRNPSLSVADGEKGLLVRCFAGCLAVDILAELRSAGHLQDDRDSFHWERPRRQIHRPGPDHKADAAALALWRAAVPGGDVVATYLRRRGVSIEVPPTLRQGSALHFGRTPIPAMVAGVQAPNREIVAVQSTFLTWGGAKAPISTPRLTTGCLGFGAVRLAAAGEVLGLAEGIETALSAMQLSGVPCWASLGGQRLAKIEIPPNVREIHIFADDDAAGRLAAEMAAGRYTRDGLVVTLRWPPEGFGDWNEVLKARAREVAA